MVSRIQSYGVFHGGEAEDGCIDGEQEWFDTAEDAQKYAETLYPDVLTEVIQLTKVLRITPEELQADAAEERRAKER